MRFIAIYTYNDPIKHCSSLLLTLCVPVDNTMQLTYAIEPNTKPPRCAKLSMYGKRPIPKATTMMMTRRIRLPHGSCAIYQVGEYIRCTCFTSNAYTPRLKELDEKGAEHAEDSARGTR